MKDPRLHTQSRISTTHSLQSGTDFGACTSSESLSVNLGAAVNVPEEPGLSPDCSCSEL